MGINGTYVEANKELSHLVNNNWRAENAKNLACSERTMKNYVQQVGGWGNLKFNLTDVMNRLHAGWAISSENFGKFSDIRFDWIDIYGVPTKYLDWVYYGSTHFPTTKEQTDNRAHWCHPLHLMLQKGRVFVPSLFRSRRKLFWHKRFYASSQFTNAFWDKTYFRTVDFFYILWSFVDLDLPSGAPQDDAFFKDILDNRYKNEWFKQTSCKWKDRVEFEKENNVNPSSFDFSSWSAFFTSAVATFKQNITRYFKNGNVSHTPMCPPVLYSKELCQAQFFYQIKFSATGRTIESVDPGSTWEIRVPQCSDVCPPKPSCSACLNDSDLSEGGSILPPALARIVGAHHQDGLDGHQKRRRDSDEEDSEEGDVHSKIRRCLDFISMSLRK